MKKCKQCGAELKDDAKFCPACGAKVLGVPLENESKTQETDIKVSEQAKGTTAKGKHNGMKIAVAFVAVVLLLGAGHIGATKLHSTTQKPDVKTADKKKKVNKKDKNSFTENVKGIGKVKIEVEKPDTSEDEYADATFKIIKDKKEYAVLPGVTDDNIQSGKKFKKLENVIVEDYDDDEQDEIIMINSYNMDHGTEEEVRSYYQLVEGEFSYDDELSELINEKVSNKTTENVKSYIEFTKQSDEVKQVYMDGAAQQKEDAEFKLFDLNGDGLPEIAAIGPSMVDGTTLATYVDGEMQELHVSGMSIQYKSGENILDDASGSMDEYYDDLYEIKDGKWNQVVTGKYGAEDNANIQVDENNQPIYVYEWNGKSVDKDEYQASLKDAFGEGVLTVLDTDTVTSTYIDQEIREIDTTVDFDKPRVIESWSSMGASSFLHENENEHAAGDAFDEDDSTAWIEGVEGQGVGEDWYMRWNQTCLVKGIKIKAGYQKDEDTYYKNSRPKMISLDFSRGMGRQQKYVLDDVDGEQIIRFEKPEKFSEISIIIESVYEGSEYDNTCITEVEFF